MLEFLKKIDTEIFLFFNGLHNPFMDEVMYWVSDQNIWIPFYVFLIFLLYKKYGAKNAGIITILILATFTLSNTLSVEAFKNVFHRLRPCHETAISNLVHIVNDHCGGQWGFVSSHASNVFGLATITFFFLSKQIKYYGALIFFWAAIVSYSRMYLGVHYPLDLLCGAMLGTSIAIIIYLASLKAGLKLAPKN